MTYIVNTAEPEESASGSVFAGKITVENENGGWYNG